MLTANDLAKINNDNPTNQGVKLGDALARGLITVQTTRAASSTAASTFVCPVGIKILFVSVLATATSTNGTLKLGVTAGDITNTIDCATDTAQSYSGNITPARQTVQAGTSITITAAGDSAATVEGEVVLYGVAV